MSSDVQADLTRVSAVGGGGESVVPPNNRGLEDLKEETDFGETRLLVSDNQDPDILYIPFNILNLKPRYVVLFKTNSLKFSRSNRF